MCQHRLCVLAHKLRHLGDVRRDPPRLVFGEQLGRWIAQITYTYIPVATPLPAALPLFATGIAGLGLLGWRRKRKAQAVT